MESASFTLVNDERAAESVEPQLEYHQALGRMAREHSEAMRDQGFFGHVTPQGQGLRQRLRATGIRFRSAGENLAQVAHPVDPASLAHRELMSSSDHRSNILNPEFDMAAVGVAKAGDTYWITQVFIRQ